MARLVEGVIGLIGCALLVAWGLGYPRASAAARERTVERRQAAGERRQQMVEVQAERRVAGHRRQLR